MPTWIILALVGLAVFLLLAVVVIVVLVLKKYSSTRGDYYTQVSRNTERFISKYMVEK